MYYIIGLLAAMLIGMALGAVIGRRNNLHFIASLITIALGAATIITASWVPLVIGTAIFLAVQAMQRDTYLAA